MRFSCDSTALVFCRFIKRCDDPGKYHPHWRDSLGRPVHIKKGHRVWMPIHAAVKLIRDKYVKQIKGA